jgi:hypothetical protein
MPSVTIKISVPATQRFASGRKIRQIREIAWA